LRSAIRRCGRVRWLAPAPAVVVGGRRSCRGGGAGRGGGCPYRSTPDRCFPAAGVADGRPMAASRPAHTSGRVWDSVVFGRDHLRIDRLSAADPLGPATRWFPREGPDRGTELRHVNRDGAVSLSSPSVGRRCADGAENRSWWWRSLAVDGSSGTSRGHPSVMRRPDEAIRSSRRAADLWARADCPGLSSDGYVLGRHSRAVALRRLLAAALAAASPHSMGLWRLA